jgi:hypothetical protein
MMTVGSKMGSYLTKVTQLVGDLNMSGSRGRALDTMFFWID